MAQDRKPTNDTQVPKQQPQPLRERVESNIAPLSDQRIRNSDVTNTMPAPPNPDRGGNNGGGNQ